MIHKITDKDLKTMSGGSVYCGVAIAMILTGKDSEHLKKQINRYRNKYMSQSYKSVYKNRSVTAAVMGTYDHEIIDVLRKNRVYLEIEKKVSGMTLKSFAKDVEFINNPLLINGGRHWMILFKGLIYDTYSPEGKLASDHDKKNCHVKSYWKVKS